MASASFSFNPFTDNFDLVGVSSGGGAITITGNDGSPQTSSSFVINGTGGLSFDWNAGLARFIISGSSSGFTWNSYAGTDLTPVTNNGYVLTNTSLVTINLPANAGSNFGDFFKIIGLSGGFTFAQTADQSIRIGEVTSTIGATGTVSTQGSTFASVTLVLVSVAGGVFIWASEAGPLGNYTAT